MKIQIEYVIIVLLIILIIINLNKRFGLGKRLRRRMGPIRFWRPGFLMSDYYPFRVPLRFRRHHRYHGGRFRRR